MTTALRSVRSSLSKDTRLRGRRIRISHFLAFVGSITIILLYFSVLNLSRTSSSDSTHRQSEKALTPRNEEHNLPKWILDYFEWHKSIRKRFPGSELFTNPNAPPILIRTCLGLCGGLNDRLGQLPWDLYLANQTGRVLLIHWHRPVPLENFLVPNEIDWTVPSDVEGFFDKQGDRVSREGMQKVRAIPDMFDGYSSANPEEEFWNKHLDLSLKRVINGTFKNEKVLRHRLLGHINEEELEDRLRALGETDMIHWTPSFGKIFFALFRLNDALHAKLNSINLELGLKSKEYSAVHCRVRHPKATPHDMVLKGKNEDYPADKSGLPWQGRYKEFAVETATKALKCVQSVLKNNEEKVYFFSDSNDLVRYMAHDLSSKLSSESTRTNFQTNEVERKARSVVSSIRIVAREAAEENAHIDRQKGREVPEYFGTFIDLFLAINARCIIYGIGYYAVLAAKISGTQCRLLYQEEFWGGEDKKRAITPFCSGDVN